MWRPPGKRVFLSCEVLLLSPFLFWSVSILSAAVPQVRGGIFSGSAPWDAKCGQFVAIFPRCLLALLDFGAEMTCRGDGKALLLLLNNSLCRWASSGMRMGFPDLAKSTSSSNLLPGPRSECV